MAQTRLIHFDVLKGVAIILVIIGHLLVLTAPTDMVRTTDIFRFLLSVHMPIFILLSGYLASRERTLSSAFSLSDTFEFLKGKFLRLILPLFFIPVLFSWIKEGGQFWEHTIVPSWTNHYWFTYSLFQTFVIFYFFRIFVLRFNLTPWLEVVLGIIYAVVVVGGCYLLKEFSPKLHSALALQFGVQRLFPIFILGYFMGRFPLLEKVFRNEYVGLLAFFAYILLFIMHRSEIGYEGVENYILTLLGLLFLYGAAYRMSGSGQSGASGSLTYLLTYLLTWGGYPYLFILFIIFSCRMPCGFILFLRV